MIDQNIITNASISLQNALTDRFQHTNDFCTIKNVFSQEVLHKVNDYILNDSDKPWALETTEHGVEMKVPRSKINWHGETVVEELHCAMESITPEVQVILKKDIKFLGIVLWQDYENYKIDWHSDNPILLATMQIYLAGSTENPGTEFKISEGNFHTCDFIPNTGYFLNQTQNRLEHHTTGKVPANVSRYSLFGMWVQA
jgi:hypothetical protein